MAVTPVDELGLLSASARMGRDYLIRISGWTEEDYLDKTPEDRLSDFWEGDIVLHSPARPRHQDVVLLLTTLLRAHTSAHRSGRVLNGPASVRLAADQFAEPDIFYIPSERTHTIGPGYVTEPPDFCVEVVSPSSRTYDLGEKAARYQNAGVREYWAIDLEKRELTVQRHASGGYERSVVKSGRVESSAVPQFWMIADWFWSDPLPSDAELFRQYLK